MSAELQSQIEPTSDLLQRHLKKLAGNIGTLEENPPMLRKIEPKALDVADIDPEQLMRRCPSCRGTLRDEKCKLVCKTPGCGFFLSCADYY